MSYQMKKELTKRLLFELLKDSKRSDRELAKVLGVSQPTVTRRRNQLVEEGVIREFTVVPDFPKMGYELMAITFGKYKVPRTPELMKKGQEWMQKYPNIIFSSRAQGKGADGIMISLHKSFTDYSKFFSDLSEVFGEAIERSENVLIDLKGFVAKPLSLSSLAKEQPTKE